MYTLGIIASQWLTHNPLAVMLIGFVVGAIVGIIADKLVHRAVLKRS